MGASPSLVVVYDELKGQLPLGLVVLKDSGKVDDPMSLSELEKALHH
ncbi:MULTISPECIES: hypothetical protein [Vibrio]|nr:MULTISPECIES: hypothetical protein [Vibrio]